MDQYIEFNTDDHKQEFDWDRNRKQSIQIICAANAKCSIQKSKPDIIGPVKLKKFEFASDVPKTQAKEEQKVVTTEQPKKDAVAPQAAKKKPVVGVKKKATKILK